MNAYTHIYIYMCVSIPLGIACVTCEVLARPLISRETLESLPVWCVRCYAGPNVHTPTHFTHIRTCKYISMCIICTDVYLYM